MGACIICSSPLTGRQGKFCGRVCKNRHTNYHHQSYQRQQARGRERKLRLIEALGGKCSVCSYRRNFAALEFHHLEPASKSFQLDMRSLAILDWESIVAEAAKCKLLCSNCHAEHHNPDALIERYDNRVGRSPNEPDIYAGRRQRPRKP